MTLYSLKDKVPRITDDDDDYEMPFVTYNDQKYYALSDLRPVLDFEPNDYNSTGKICSMYE